METLMAIALKRLHCPLQPLFWKPEPHQFPIVDAAPPTSRTQPLLLIEEQSLGAPLPTPALHARFPRPTFSDKMSWIQYPTEARFTIVIRVGRVYKVPAPRSLGVFRV